MKWSGKLKPEDVENAAINDGTTPSGETVPAAGKGTYSVHIIYYLQLLYAVK